MAIPDDESCKPLYATLLAFMTLFLAGFGEFLQGFTFVLFPAGWASIVWKFVVFSISVFYITICFLYATEGTDREHIILRSLRYLSYGMLY